jgi:hypothetical protein
VVLDVAGGEHGGLLALEFLEQHLRLLAQGVHQHVEAAAVGHADDHLLHADRAGGADQLVHGEDQRLAALQREALLADVAGVQIALQRLGLGDHAQEAALVLGAPGWRRATGLQPGLDPALLRHIREVHVLGADGAAVGLAQRLEDLAQRGLLGRGGKAAGGETLAEVGLGEAIESRIELLDGRPLGAFERIELGPAVAEEAIGIDELQHGDLLLVRAGARGRGAQRAELGTLGEGGDHRGVGDVAAGGAAGQVLQPVEIIAPDLGNRGRVLEIGLVELLDEGRIGAEKIGVAEHLFH